MKWVIGIDEVGRGPLAGPVTVCAVAMPLTIYKKGGWHKTLLGLNDSKQMSPALREQCYIEAESLAKKGKVHYAITSRTAAMIDKKGIAVCIRECIAANVKKLALDPEACLVLLDGGLKAPREYVHQQTIIKGDMKEKIISLASVIAKVQRDHFMVALDKKHPAYAWHRNKGYGTKAHIQAIKKEGLTPLHRRSFLTRIT